MKIILLEIYYLGMVVMVLFLMTVLAREIAIIEHMNKTMTETNRKLELIEEAFK